MRRYSIIILISVLSAVLVTGCGGPNRSVNSINTGDNVGGDDSALLSGDEDFDLFEDDLDGKMIVIRDPLEGVNRFIFNVNDVIYEVVLNPVAGLYEVVVWEPVRIGIDNFFQNITTPVRFVSCLLQGKGEAADIEWRRFWINTTEGILGFGDPARDKYGLEMVKEDLGQTLAVWGMDDGFYIVWPILGPSTFRDSLGMAGDMFLNPVWYVEPCGVRAGISGVKFVNKASFHVDEYEAMFGDEMDAYAAARQAYLQYRARLIKE